MKVRSLVRVLVAWVLMTDIAFGGGSYRVAIYYFPGWKDGVEGFLAREPWEKIKPFPDREPLLGWYNEADPAVMAQHLKWMRSYSIDTVIFDWYWQETDKPFLDHAINNYLSLPDHQGVGFSILWANHNRVPLTHEQFRRIVQLWITKYFSRPDYMREDGMPVVFLFSPEGLERSARQFGSSVPALLLEAQAMARQSGLPGIFFVGNSSTAFGERSPANWGFSALTGYVYRKGFSGAIEPYPRNYSDMDASYRRTWSWIVKNIDLPYFPAVVHGWDMRPWGGTPPQDSCCVSSPAQFGAHVSAALDLIERNPQKTRRTLIVCCWNEFGEGNYLEPTKKSGFAFLDALKSALATGGRAGVALPGAVAP